MVVGTARRLGSERHVNPEGGSPSQFLNSGGLYHLTHNQQLDFHFAVGLNHNAPSYIVGVGYSFRVDGLFR